MRRNLKSALTIAGAMALWLLGWVVFTDIQARLMAKSEELITDIDCCDLHFRDHPADVLSIHEYRQLQLQRWLLMLMHPWLPKLQKPRVGQRVNTTERLLILKKPTTRSDS